ncbi:MAG: DUF342 domain-containing protein [Candidatus Magnetomorum sp.]|nr:DUF342 domain-containing protein [Candidatus Magnetomorum sp.]
MSDMALLTVPCPKCGKVYRIYRTNLGRMGICKKCTTRFKMIQREKTPAKKPARQFAPVVRSVPPEKSGSKIQQVIEKMNEISHDINKKIDQESKQPELVEPEKKEDPPQAIQAPIQSIQEKKKIETAPSPVKEKPVEINESPAPLLVSNKNLDILAAQLKVIVTDGMKAYLVEKTKMDSDVNIADLKKFLAREKVIFGLVSDEKIQSFIDKRLNRIKPFLIAKGRTPTEPTHGLIEYFFDTHPIKNIAPALEEDQERINYKERGEMPFVLKGDLIAQRIPGIPGKYGKDVFGKRIEAQKARQASLKCGNGATLSEDKRMAHARIDGMPVLTTGRYERVNILPQYYINGDVNMKTGNIRFQGPVVVKGTVQSGFKIRCASLEAKELFRADARVNGDINIQGGVVGSKVVCMGTFKAKFVKGTTIECENDIIVKNGILDSKIETRTNCIVENNKILTSSIIAFKDIVTNDLGSKSSPGCQLTIGMDPVVIREMERLKNELKLLEEKVDNEKEELDVDSIEELEDECKDINKKIDTLEPTLIEAKKISLNLIHTYKTAKQQKQLQQQKKLLDAIRLFSAKIGPAKQELAKLKNDQKNINTIIQKIQQLRQEIDFTTSEIQRINREIQTTDHEAKVLVKGELFPGTTIRGATASLEIFEKQSNVTIEEIHIYNENNMPERQIEIKSLHKDI